MTPSNQHSDEAIAAYPDDNRTPYMKEIEPEPLVLSMQRTAFDRGRASAPVSERGPTTPAIRALPPLSPQPDTVQANAEKLEQEAADSSSLAAVPEPTGDEQ